MTENLSQADPFFGLMQATLSNICRLSATLGEARRQVLKAHMKAMDEQLKTCKATLAKISEAKDWEAIQASCAKAASDQAEHQAALAREYGKLVADGVSSWMEECRACGDQWLAIERTQPQSGVGSPFSTLSTALTDFYDRLGHMSLVANGKMVEERKAEGTSRVRQSS
ncbi:hypothetical protein [Cupriavidus pauculus]|uniref:hypothetical protein n=1 Tax=Cupriavidus pauculus TaxID=82633 RepID=UPI000A400A54|nr:hypothetical protein [Cupriavidus pauculus]